MSTPLPTRSIFKPNVTVYVDPWSVNALLDDAVQSIPATVNAVIVSNGDAPTMFESGDLPPFTASGIDPQVLASLPWKVRHAAAAEPSTAIVYKWLEQFVHSEPGVEAPTAPGLDEFVSRFQSWLRGQWTNPAFRGADPAQQAAAEGDLYDALFGADEAARKVQLDAVNTVNVATPTGAHVQDGPATGTGCSPATSVAACPRRSSPRCRLTYITGTAAHAYHRVT